MYSKNFYVVRKNNLYATCTARIQPPYSLENKLSYYYDCTDPWENPILNSTIIEQLRTHSDAFDIKLYDHVNLDIYMELLLYVKKSLTKQFTNVHFSNETGMRLTNNIKKLFFEIIEFIYVNDRFQLEFEFQSSKDDTNVHSHKDFFEQIKAWCTERTVNLIITVDTKYYYSKKYPKNYSKIKWLKSNK